MIRRDTYTYTPVCDMCGCELDAEYGYLEAASAMRLNGWEKVRASDMSPEWYNFCPACKDTVKKNG